jgi:hypothetical protein
MASEPIAEPEISYLFPLGGQQGTKLEVEIRGKNLAGVYAVWSSSDYIKPHVHKVVAIEPADAKKQEKSDQREHKVLLQVELAATARVGTHFFRVVSPLGVSNAVDFHVHSDARVMESELPHGAAEQAQEISFPAVIHGVISKPGELDYYGFDVLGGQELVFEATSSQKAIATGFYPLLELYEPTGSWLDPHRATRILFDSENNPKTIPSNAGLTYRYGLPDRFIRRQLFKKPGRYLIQVGSFKSGYGGKGGPECVYQLRMAQVDRSVLSQDKRELDWVASPDWKERAFTRKLEPDWIESLWGRTVRPRHQEVLTSREVPRDPPRHSDTIGEQKEATSGFGLVATSTPLIEKEPNNELQEATEIAIPVLIEGIIQHPGDIDTFRFKVTPGQRLAFEIEASDVVPPLFNPRLQIMDAAGREILTNIHKRIRRDLAISYLKAMEPKVIDTFEVGGEYFLQIRDITFRYGTPNYKYRVMVRAQIPHLGKFQVNEDHINLLPGHTKKLTIVGAAEEGFSGDIAILVKGLPLGVEAFPGTDVETKVPSTQESDKEESFLPKAQKVTVVLQAHSDAAATLMPHFVRIVVQPIVNGERGSDLKVGDIPLMVVKGIEAVASGEKRTAPR